MTEVVRKLKTTDPSPVALGVDLAFCPWRAEMPYWSATSPVSWDTHIWAANKELYCMHYIPGASKGCPMEIPGSVGASIGNPFEGAGM